VRMPTSCWSATLLMTVLKGLFAWGYFCGGVLSWWTGTAPPYFIVDDWTSLCSMLIDLVFSVQLLGSFPLSYVILKRWRSRSLSLIDCQFYTEETRHECRQCHTSSVLHLHGSAMSIKILMIVM
jgi:hypothetical protein